MRNFKIFLWIFIIFLLQTVVMTRLHIYSAVPSLVVPYMVCVMLFDTEFGESMIIAVICSVSAGSLCGREFVVMTLYLFYVSLMVFATKKKPLYISREVKAFLWTFIISGVMEILFLFLARHTLTIDMLLYAALPTAIINTLFVIIICPLLKKTMYKEDKPKLLIGDLV